MNSDINAGDLKSLLDGQKSKHKQFVEHLYETYEGIKRSTQSHLQDELIKSGYRWQSDGFGVGRSTWREFYYHQYSKERIMLEWSLKITSDHTDTPDKLIGVY